jgi:hypothetical protein
MKRKKLKKRRSAKSNRRSKRKRKETLSLKKLSQFCQKRK